MAGMMPRPAASSVVRVSLGSLCGLVFPRHGLSPVQTGVSRVTSANLQAKPCEIWRDPGSC